MLGMAQIVLQAESNNVSCVRAFLVVFVFAIDRCCCGCYVLLLPLWYADVVPVLCFWCCCCACCGGCCGCGCCWFLGCLCSSCFLLWLLFLFLLLLLLVLFLL